MKATRTWILIADGGRAKVVEKVGRQRGFRNVDGMAFSARLPKSREILADKPGRAFDSVGAGCHAKENTVDPHRELKRKFAMRLGSALRKQLLADRFDRLVLVAPPPFLGDLRKELPKDVRAKVDGEVTADLTKTPKGELGSQLEQMLG